MQTITDISARNGTPTISEQYSGGMITTNEQLYQQVSDASRLVKRVGLREALGCLDPELRDRVHAKEAVSSLFECASGHQSSGAGAERNTADFIRSETLDAAYQLDINLHALTSY